MNQFSGEKNDRLTFLSIFTLDFSNFLTNSKHKKVI